eukprot:GHRR01031450.1.p1 GENE.GHRR01031450.1~~GHRR01031450.1.p1  ORF type:complete len:143 (+),score=9.99 GHRR01031450.1:655-1083(+)
MHCLTQCICCSVLIGFMFVGMLLLSSEFAGCREFTVSCETFRSGWSFQMIHLHLMGSMGGFRMMDTGLQSMSLCNGMHPSYIFLEQVNGHQKHCLCGLACLHLLNGHVADMFMYVSVANFTRRGRADVSTLRCAVRTENWSY